MPRAVPARQRHKRSALNAGRECAFCRQTPAAGAVVAGYKLCAHHWALVCAIAREAGIPLTPTRHRNYA